MSTKEQLKKQGKTTTLSFHYTNLLLQGVQIKHI